jgi:dTDP-4-amino-4,6-dideoxygalactose transaminase
LSRIALPTQPDGWFSSGHKFVAMVENRATRLRLTAAMAANEIEMGRGVYEKPLNVQPIFREYAKRSFPLAADFAARHVCFPIFRSLREDELQRVIDTVQAFAW